MVRTKQDIPPTPAGNPVLAGKLASALTHHQAGRLDKAEKIYRKILKSDPAHADALHMLGLLTHQRGRHDRAIGLLERALASGPASAELHTNLGSALHAQGRIDEAMAAFRAALGINPDFSLAWNNLGNACRAAGRSEEALAAFHHAIRITPGYALAHFNLGNLLHAMGRREEAKAALRQAIDLAPNQDAACSDLAILLMEEGDGESAREWFERALQLNGRNAVARHMLAALAGETTSTAPAEYVVKLFDGCAAYFDRQLVGELGYRAPEQIQRAVLAHTGAEVTGLDIMDLGCGTGLCGPLFRAHARSLTGVDLSPGMLDRARERAVYDELVQGDLVEVLAPVTGGYDLLLAADVFIYVGALEKVIPAAARALRAGGMLAFSIEALDTGADYALRSSGRYAHSHAYIRRLAGDAGLGELAFEPAVLRQERGEAIRGHICILQKPHAAGAASGQ
jgi:predicted TPR repeat methyltransferase